jgi:hypothetical protein
MMQKINLINLKTKNSNKKLPKNQMQKQYQKHKRVREERKIRDKATLEVCSRREISSSS